MRPVRLLGTSVLLAGLFASSTALGAPVWQQVSDLSATGRNAFASEVAVDDAGDATAVWLRSDGTNDIVQAATRPAGGVWSAPVDLSAAGQNAIEPQVAVDGAGNATAVWSRSNGANFIVQADTRPAGGVWSAPVDLSTAGQSAEYPRVAIDGTGNATAVWYRFNGTDYVVQTATRPAGGIWQSLTDLSAPGQSATNPRVAVNAAGNVVAFWGARTNGLDNVVQAATRSADGVWSARADQSATGESADYPQVAIDGAGNATAVWYRSDGTNFIVQAAMRPAGGVWSSATDLSTAGRSATGPQIALDGAGNATAVWYRFNGSNYVVQAATRPATGAWSSATDLSAIGQDARDPRVAVDGAGNATAVWYRFNGSTYVVQVGTRPATGGWSAPTDLSATGGDASGSRLAVDGAGNVTAVWSRSNGTNLIVQARGLDVSGPVVRSLVIPPTAVAGKSTGFQVDALDVWSAIATGAWTFGDGASATGMSVRHTYAAARTYPVTVTLTDTAGNTTTRTGQITVTAAPRGVAVSRCPTRPAFNAVGNRRDHTTSFYFRTRPGETIRGNRHVSLLATAKGRSRLARVEYVPGRTVNPKKLPRFARLVHGKVVVELVRNAGSSAYQGLRIKYPPKKGTYAKLILPTGTVITPRCPRIRGYKTIYAQNLTR